MKSLLNHKEIYGKKLSKVWLLQSCQLVLLLQPNLNQRQLLRPRCKPRLRTNLRCSSEITNSQRSLMKNIKHRTLLLKISILRINLEKSSERFILMMEQKFKQIRFEQIWMGVELFWHLKNQTCMQSTIKIGFKNQSSIRIKSLNLLRNPLLEHIAF